MAANRAAWLKVKQQKPFEIDEAPMPEAREHEVVIRAHALGINPCDPAIQTHGMVWKTYPHIIGCDVAGEIVQVGPRVTGFQKGDRVIASLEDKAFSLFSKAEVATTAKLPDSISYVEGSVLPLCLSTAAVSIFDPNNLALPPPQLQPKPTGKVVLVWGGSSVVGSCGIQMIRAAGYDVVATSGLHNFQHSRDLGASSVFDYSSVDVVQDIVAAVEGMGSKFAGVFASVFSPGVIAKCAQIADRLGKDETSRVVATVLPSNMPFTEPIPDGVRIAYSDGGLISDSSLHQNQGIEKPAPSDVAENVWGKWLTPALEMGLMKCKPEPEVVGKGLESIQHAVDLMSEGVSAKKLVVVIL